MENRKTLEVTQAFHSFQQRLDYFYDDVELVDIIERYREKKGLDEIMDEEILGKYRLSRRQKKNTTMKNLLGHLRQTVYTGVIKEIYEEVTDYLRVILNQAAENGYEPKRIIGEHDCKISAKSILGKNHKDIIKMVSDNIFQQLEAERSTIELITKIAKKLGLNLNKKYINDALPFLELRHLLVHNDGRLSNEFSKKYKIEIKLNSKRRISPDHNFMIDFRNNIEKMVKNIDECIIENNLLRKENIRKNQQKI